MMQRFALMIFVGLWTFGVMELPARDPVHIDPDQVERVPAGLTPVHRAVREYQAAMGARDGERASEFVTRGTFDYYRTILFWTMYGGEQELTQLDTMEMFLVLRLRQRLQREEMKAVEGDGRAAYVLVVRRGSEGDTGFASAAIVQVRTEDDVGRVQMRMSSRGEFSLFVRRENDRWLMDLPFTMQHVNRELGGIMKARRVRMMLGLNSQRELAALYPPPFPDGPENAPGFFFLRGTMRLERDRFEEALADFSRAIQGDPSNAAWFEIRGDLLQVLRRPDEARRDYDRALALEPGRPGAHLGRAEIFLSKEDTESAIVESNRALLSDPFFRDALLVRGSAHQAAGRFEQAHEDFTRSIQQRARPGDVQGHLYRADLYWEFRRKPEAIADAEAAFRIDPGNERVKRTLARYYAYSGMKHESVLELTHACLEKDQNQPECLDARSESWLRTGELNLSEQANKLILQNENLDRLLRESVALRRAKIKVARENERP